MVNETTPNLDFNVSYDSTLDKTEVYLLKNKNDLRVIKTENQINAAFISLIQSKATDKITISELAKEAQIQRKTFYLHYQSIDELILKFEKSLLVEIKNLLAKIDPSSINELTFGLNQLLMQHYIFYQNIFKARNNLFLTEDCKNIFASALAQHLKTHSSLNQIQTEFYANFIAAGIVETYSNWFEHDSNLKINDLTNHINTIINPIFNDIIKK
ncbi:hypothetical protein FC70_GL000163 [Paucilactobacillus oligofermentans DSM 15707 = LMG 22743]|uniref:HTH tetR-type domain-containing protein n=1 Tax=Paucilactobacillus oligofermentans DSM 15707 = LMG 22743 TaxID=1423778 RepID=A0A0R1RUT6_9LACO|nr:hypothetical protein FC70_GL000163 [Paucilactobacillus oligofermentans DSM 15707 = LMG 22743]